MTLNLTNFILACVFGPLDAKNRRIRTNFYISNVFGNELISNKDEEK